MFVLAALRLVRTLFLQRSRHSFYGYEILKTQVDFVMRLRSVHVMPPPPDVTETHAVEDKVHCPVHVTCDLVDVLHQDIVQCLQRLPEA